MPKRKSAPVRNLNNAENWSWNLTEESSEQQIEEIPKKKIRKFRSLTVNISKYQVKDEKYFLGKMLIGTSHNIFPENWTKCKINFSESVLKLNFDNNCDCVLKLFCNEEFIRDSFSSKLFKYDFKMGSDMEQVFLLFYLSDIPTKKFNKKNGQVLKEFLSKMFDIEVINFEEKKNCLLECENIEQLYNDIKDYKDINLIHLNDLNVQHHQLLPMLRPYQENAVKWMLQKETLRETKEGLHPLYVTIQLESGEEIYLNKYTGFIDNVRPVSKYLCTGGILADEMGLGKTVEVLACILNHPRAPENKIEPKIKNESIPDICENISGDIDSEILKSNKILNEIDKNNSSVTINVQNNTEINLDLTESIQEIPDIKNIDDSASHSSEFLEENIPKIELQQKYMKPKQKDVIKVKLQKPIEKVKKKMSSAKIAAQMWYENKLAEMKIIFRPKRDKIVEEVQCICGDFSRDEVVKCCDCSKLQHAKCMAYEGDEKLYCCSQCWTKRPLLKSKATLIIAPISICRQWSLEVQNHIRKNGLRVLEYKGIHQAGMIYPTDLADYDLVITTYTVLQSELKFIIDEPSTFSFRNAKRYNPPSTPLVLIEWWRLCLDEAQTVECPWSQVSNMAGQLNAVNRWAVTGTPMQKNIRDLFGLIDYLKISPFDDLETWNNVLYFPYINGDKKPLIEFLVDIMWRSAKVNVIEQINIPPQTSEEHWLEFSAVEKFFYKREHEMCAATFLEKLTKFKSLDVTLKTIDKQTLNLILMPLLNLRQTCNHPKVTRGKYLATRRQVNNMEELLDVLIKKNVNECEENLRAIIASLNGMAGILLLQERSVEAVEQYREALRYISKYENEGILKIDKLQKIHTLHNLSEVLTDKSYPTPPPTLRDENLKDECIQVQNKYMEKFITETHTARKDLALASKTIENLQKKLQLDESRWCLDFMDWCIEQNLDHELIRRINGALENLDRKSDVATSTKNIGLMIRMWMDKIDVSLKKIRKYFNEFEKEHFTAENNYHISQSVVNHAMECHLRPAKNTPKKMRNMCVCCLMDRHLKCYEGVIFSMKTKENTENVKNAGSWKPCKEEIILKTILAFAKTKNGESIIITKGETHLALCEALRKEFKELRKLYMFYDQLVSAQDELNICKIRFRLRNLDEPKKSAVIKKNATLRNLDYVIENKNEFINVFDPFELDCNYDILINDMKMSEVKLKKSLGTYNYLITLQKRQFDGQNTDPCPICGSQLSETWSILQCGHCYCLECIHKLLQQFSNGNNVSCSVCRKKQYCDDITYIRVKHNIENKSEEVEVKGSHSTKNQAIIHSVLTLKNKDPDVKILMFSTWSYVLKILSEALTLNEVEHEIINNTAKLQDKLQKFKSKKKGITALLLPIRLGAKGLNLIEATHVFLVEPLMNPGEELQAVGRVHRIGQTKPTTVHRFLIKNTIEENIYNAVSENVQKWDKNKLTLQQLRDLFTEKNDPNLTENDSHIDMDE